MIHTQDADFTLLQGDVLDCLRELPDESVHCVVTSPPYWGLRDYGTGSWDGGDAGCDHKKPGANKVFGNPAFNEGRPSREQTETAGFRDTCGKCGARRQDRQLGLESTPDEYVARMVEVFREVRRVLRADGTCWVNLGDSYLSNVGGKPDGADTKGGVQGHVPNAWGGGSQSPVDRPSYLKPKDLAGMPWRVAFALQADGWYLRSDIIWSKPNPMPESVTDRPTKAHEYVFLLSKSSRYFFDQEAVRERAEWARWGDQTVGKGSNPDGWIKPKTKQELVGKKTYDGFNGRWDESVANGSAPAGRNVRSVWEIATQPYPEAHFATYPEELVRRCILAGTSERGCCPVCGKPWEREVEHTPIQRYVTGKTAERQAANAGVNDARTALSGAIGPKSPTVVTLGWRPGCECFCSNCGDPYEDHEAFSCTYGFMVPIPYTVLDPFLGSGTTAYVARKHGRRSIGIELNPEYCKLAARRMQQQSLFAVES